MPSPLIERMEEEKLELRPFKIHGDLIAALVDVDGDIVGEVRVAGLELHRKRFGGVEAICLEACSAFETLERDGGEVEGLVEASRGATGGT